MTEGMELTRGTKKIIQEAIDTVSDEFKSDRIRLCEEFCRIVEQRYTGGAMGYQLKRMGNTYPFDLLAENAWTLQDALDSDLGIFVNSEWFMSYPLHQDDNGTIWKQVECELTPIDRKKDTLDKAVAHISQVPYFTEDDLTSVKMEHAHAPVDKTTTTTLPLWVHVTEEESAILEEKLFWLSDLVMEHHSDGTVVYMDTDEALNFTASQAKHKGMSLGKENNIKIPLNSTGPILEAIDKFLYDKTGQYVM